MITITEKEKCTGCFACANICPLSCISMDIDSEGFWYPVVDLNSCNDCNLCVDVCPVLQKTEVKNDPKAYACINKDELTRLKSSSGGIFSLIAEKTIENGGVVFGAKFNDSFEVIHDSIVNKADIESFRGSKYVQSKIGDTYKQAKECLSQGKQVLFSGTPCQIEGLKAYLMEPYDNLLCIDNICHGVPSPAVFKKYIEYQENVAGFPVKKIMFRNKDEGWKKFSMSLLFGNNKKYRKNLETDMYLKLFLSDVCLRPSCYVCSFKSLHRESDITLADFWGIQNILPKMYDDKGASLVFVNSANGKKAFEEIQDDMICKEVEINNAVYYNQAAIKSVKLNPQRDDFFKELNFMDFDKLANKYSHSGYKNRCKTTVRKVLSKSGLLGITKKVLRRDGNV